jgi:NAD(P)-dependent dehydrogenase (short-subunit alcohol dehydrogenase family)/acyl dehydratase
VVSPEHRTAADDGAGRAAGTVRFTTDDLDWFASASHDANPLHVDEAFARHTAYGHRVVHGVLGALTGLGHIPPRPDQRVCEMTLDFRQPLYVGVDYSVDVETAEDNAAVAIHDGSRLQLRAKARFVRSARSGVPNKIDVVAPTVRTEAADRTLNDVHESMTVEGRYAPAWPATIELLRGLHLDERGIGTGEIATLLLLSYVVGMELPGRRALFSRARIRFSETEAPNPAVFHFGAELVKVDERVNFTASKVLVSAGERVIAECDVSSFVHRDLERMSDATFSALLPCPPTLTDRAAAVIGGSRGLGAAFVRGLALQGADVHLTYRSSRAEAAAVAACLPEAAPPVRLHEGDAADAAWAAAFGATVAAAHDGLDLLVCNACPPLVPLPVHAAAMARIRQHINDSVALVGEPLAALLPHLAQRNGWCVVVSSVAVTDPPADWPHYVGAKAAIESFIQVAALQNRDVRFLVVRPPRLATDLTNTPLGPIGALPPEEVVSAVVRRLSGPPPALGEAEVLDMSTNLV